MFLRSTTRWKDGKKHYYWSIVENRRCRGDRIVQQTVLYLGEINDSQQEQWIREIEVFDQEAGAMEQLKLFAAERRRLLAAAPDRVEIDWRTLLPSRLCALFATGNDDGHVQAMLVELLVGRRLGGLRDGSLLR
jgi:hypothetical protein